MVKPLLLPSVISRLGVSRSRFKTELKRRERPLNITPSCVLSLDFNEERGNRVIDASRQGNHGIIYGARWWRSRNEEMGSCLKFDGVDDYVRVPDSGSLDVATGEITIVASIYPAALPTSASRILGKETGTNTDSYALICSATPKAALYVGTGKLVATNSLIPIAAWSFIAGTYVVATRVANIYLNGILDNSASLTAGLAITTYPVLIGNNPTNTRQFNGFIDEPRIYNRALTAGEIKHLYYLWS